MGAPEQALAPLCTSVSLISLQGGRETILRTCGSRFSLYKCKNPSSHQSQHLLPLHPRTVFAMQTNCANRTDSPTCRQTLIGPSLNSHELLSKCAVLRGSQCWIWAPIPCGPPSHCPALRAAGWGNDYYRKSCQYWQS